MFHFHRKTSTFKFSPDKNDTNNAAKKFTQNRHRAQRKTDELKLTIVLSEFHV